MPPLVHLTRSPAGSPLEGESVATLRALIAERGARRLVVPLGVSLSTIERAASGGIVLRGSRALILAGLERMREGGALSPPAEQARRGGR